VNVIYAAIGGAGFAVFGIALVSFLFKHQKPGRSLKARPLPGPPSDADANGDDEVAPEEGEEVNQVSEADLEQKRAAEQHELASERQKILKKLRRLSPPWKPK
jgi:hypothetical protein